MSSHFDVSPELDRRLNKGLRAAGGLGLLLLVLSIIGAVFSNMAGSTAYSRCASR